MPSFITLVLAALIGAGLAAGDLGARLERGLREQMPSARTVQVEVDAGERPRLGQLDSVAVTVRDVDARELPLTAMVPRAAPRALKGRFGRLSLRAELVHLDLMRASEVTFAAEEVRFDLTSALLGSQTQVTSLGSQRLTVVLRDGDLNEYAASAYPGVDDARITFERGELVFRGRVPFFLAAFDATIRGRLAIADGRKLVMPEPHIDAGRVQLSDEIRAELTSRLNPILDLDRVFDFPVPLVWNELTVGDGEARLVGRLEELPPPRPDEPFQPRRRYER